MSKKTDKPVPNVSGTFQVVNNERQEDLKEVEKTANLDEESTYYARLFYEE